jgi:serine/threonine protein kinase
MHSYYLAPELDDDEAESEHTTSVDVFSFGIIIYELVCGRRAFRSPPSINCCDQLLLVLVLQFRRQWFRLRGR